MKIFVIDRRRIIGEKWFRYQKMKGSVPLGFKIAIGRYEFRFYKKISKNGQTKNRRF